MDKSTKTIIWVSVAVIIAGGAGFAAWMLLAKPKPSGQATAPPVSGQPAPPVGSWSEPPQKPNTGSSSGGTTQAPKGTTAPKLPTTWEQFSLKFPDGAPFIALINASHLNIQIKALGVNKSFAFTQSEKDAASLALSKGESLENVIGAYMYKKGLTSATKVKNAK